jgi:hypothetical protein
VKFSNPAGALSRRLIESIHGQYIEQLHDTSGWDKASIVEMLLLCDGSVDNLRAAHKRWIVAVNVDRAFVGGGVHDSLRSFLAMLHHERDAARERAKEVRRRMIRANYADFIAARVAKFWPENEIVTCLELCGSPAAFQAAFAEWVGPKGKPNTIPAYDFITFLRRRNVPPVDDEDAS